MEKTPEEIEGEIAALQQEIMDKVDDSNKLYDLVLERMAIRERNTRNAEWKNGPPPHIQPKEVESTLLPIAYWNRKQQRAEKFRKVNGRRVNRY